MLKLRLLDIYINTPLVSSNEFRAVSNSKTRSSTILCCVIEGRVDFLQLQPRAQVCRSRYTDSKRHSLLVARGAGKRLFECHKSCDETEARGETDRRSLGFVWCERRADQ